MVTRTFTFDEVAKIALDPHARRQWLFDNRDIRRARQQEQARIARQQAKASARTYVQGLQRRHDTSTICGGGEIPWVIIMEKLVSGMDNLRSPAVIARDICNASMCCKSAYESSYKAWQLLDRQLVGQLPNFVNVPYDDIVKCPHTFTVPVLKTVCSSLRKGVSATKPELILRIMASFGIDRPTRVPARVLSAVHRENSGWLSERWSDLLRNIIPTVSTYDIFTYRTARLLLSRIHPNVSFDEMVDRSTLADVVKEVLKSENTTRWSTVRPLHF
jgi:hypothetical protein